MVDIRVEFETFATRIKVSPLLHEKASGLIIGGQWAEKRGRYLFASLPTFV